MALAPWIEAVRAGRTFVTNGPLLFVEVDGQGPGTVLSLPAQGQTVRIRAHARSAVGFDRLEIVAGGNVVASATTGTDRHSAVLEGELPWHEPGWLAARCWSSDRLADGQCVFAHTGPVYFVVEGKVQRPDKQAATSLLQILQRTTGWVANEARCTTARHRERLTGYLQAAQQILQGRLGE
jgi:hypothetical protein